MKKSILSLVLFLLVFTGFATNASAKDLTRRFGLGADSTISNYADDGKGFSAVFYINRYFGLQAIFGLNLIKADVSTNEGKFDTTITEWNASLRALIPIMMTQDVNLTGVVGFSASGRASDGFKARIEEYQKYNDGYQFSIDVGIRPEWFVNEFFSIHTQVGIGIDIITSNGSTLNTGLDSSGGVHHSTDASGVSVSFFKNVDLIGMAGFTFWFGSFGS